MATIQVRVRQIVKRDYGQFDIEGDLDSVEEIACAASDEIGARDADEETEEIIEYWDSVTGKWCAVETQ